MRPSPLGAKMNIFSYRRALMPRSSGPGRSSRTLRLRCRRGCGVPAPTALRTGQPMSAPLTDRRGPTIGPDGYEQSELEVPRSKLREAGAQARVASLKNGAINGWEDGDWGNAVHVVLVIADA